MTIINTKRDPIQNVERTNILFELSLLGEAYEPVYDRLTELASKIIGVPVSLMSMVVENRQFFKSEVGLPEEWSKKRQTGLSHSFCKHVVRQNEPLIVNDAREDERVKYNLAIRDLNVIDYLGIPMTLADGNTLGSFCVIDDKPHNWTETEIKIMRELAAIVTLEFDARAYARRKRISEEDLQNLQNRLLAFADSINPNQSKLQTLDDIIAARSTHDLYEVVI